MAKLLNLDALSTVNVKVLVHKEQEHKIIERTVGQVINAVKFQRKQEDRAMTPDEELEVALTMIQEAIPTFPVEDLKTLEMTKLSAILDFIASVETVETPEGKS